MFKLLIVDDEKVERDGLQAILKKGFPDLTIEQARNGKIAIEMVDSFQPDIIFMDIQMAGMTGLEAVEVIRQKWSNIRIVILSAYEAFDYARTALKFGVKDYLLKPTKAKEIIEAVGKIMQEIESERQAEAANQAQAALVRKALPLMETDVVTQLLFDHVHDVHLEELLHLLGVEAHSEMFVLNVSLPAGAEQFYGSIRERIHQQATALVGAIHSRQLPILIFHKGERSQRSMALALAQDILAVSKTDQAIGWFVGIGNSCRTWEAIRQSYQEAVIAGMDTSGAVKYRFYSDANFARTSRDTWNKDQEKLFLEAIRLGEWEKIHTGLLDFVHQLERQGTDLILMQQQVLELLWLVTRLLRELDIDLPTPMFALQMQDSKQLLREAMHMLDQLKSAHSNHVANYEPDTIQQIKKFILEHSHEDISLEFIARKVDMSPIYISKLFKDQLGVNYIDFLTECRIEKAKKLMQNPEKSVKEITFEIGYHDPNYFSKVFRKICDISPTDYRKQLFEKMKEVE